MAFIDRVVDYPGRYTLKDANSGTVFGTYDLVRDEGTIHEPGTLLNANNLNNPDITSLSIGGVQVKDYTVELGSSGAWKWRKWANGRFEAILHSSAGSTGTMTQLGSSGIYYSAVSAVTFPTDIGIASIDYCSAVCSPPSNFFMMMITNRLSTSSVYIGYLRFGSGASVSNVDYSVKIEGTWT